MTCVVACMDNNSIVLGADKIAGNTDICMPRIDTKIFQVTEDLYVGFEGSWRVGQLLRFHFKLPRKQKIKENDHTFLSTVFVKGLSETLDNHNYVYSGATDDEKMSASLILAYKGNLYEVDTDFNVGQYATEFLAIGSGYQYAYGSLISTKDLLPTKNRVETALNAASVFCPGIKPPYDFIVIERDK